jgi:hypothetical protein
MKPDKKPEVIDFDRYKAAQAQVKAKEDARLKAQAKAAAKPPGAGGSESFLGSRPRAGLILVLLIVALALLLVAPRFMTLIG